MTHVLTLNAGSSSLKYGLYEAAQDPRVVTHGRVGRIGGAAQLVPDGADTRPLPQVTDHAGALRAVLDHLRASHPQAQISAVGHRVVHGGMDQVACFDTAFHRGHPFVNDTFALPRAYYDKGVRRYGFHGLSYDYIAGELARSAPDLSRVVVAHLGNGASMCALRDGRSVASTMGFSALDGLPMGTRVGQLDPGVVLYLMAQEGMSADQISDLLYKDAGLKGMSGISNDMRELLASDDPRAGEALDYYTFRIRRELGALAAVLGGIDGLVFCGGIGENAAPIRARVCDGMEWIGITLDAARNAANAPVISNDNGAVRVMVIPTDEEIVIARAAVALGG